jgi:hypothetical protein
MRKPNGLTKLYKRYPTKEEIERDFDSHRFDAWRAVTELYEYLEACHQDGLLKDVPGTTAEQALSELVDAIYLIEDELVELDLPVATPTAAAEPASATA